MRFSAKHVNVYLDDIVRSGIPTFLPLGRCAFKKTKLLDQSSQMINSNKLTGTSLRWGKNWSLKYLHQAVVGFRGHEFNSPP